MIKRILFLIVVCTCSNLGAVSAATANPASAEPQFQNMRAALNALKAAKSPDEIRRIQEILPQVPVDGHDDVMALYAEAAGREDRTPSLADNKTYDEYTDKSGAIAARLRGCTAPMLQDDIAILIDKEATAWHASAIPFLQHTPQEAVKSGLRLARVEALLDAAGKGKNEKARPALWKMIDKVQDDYFGQIAVRALGQIGNPEDLDRLIGMRKGNPKLKLSLGSFGTMMIPRVMREMDDPSVSDNVKAGLSLDLVAAASHDNLSAYVPLLQHSNSHVVEAASKAIMDHAQNSDDALIQNMFTSKSMVVRGRAALTVSDKVWDTKYASSLMNMLKNDPATHLRGLAANILGRHKVQAAVPALQAALKDSAGYVRQNAEWALKHISGEVK
jgi:HEAT repeat protein